MMPSFPSAAAAGTLVVEASAWRIFESNELGLPVLGALAARSKALNLRTLPLSIDVGLRMLTFPRTLLKDFGLGLLSNNDGSNVTDLRLTRLVIGYSTGLSPAALSRSQIAPKFGRAAGSGLQHSSTRAMIAFSFRASGTAGRQPVQQWGLIVRRMHCAVVGTFIVRRMHCAILRRKTLEGRYILSIHSRSASELPY